MWLVFLNLPPQMVASCLIYCERKRIMGSNRTRIAHFFLNQ